MSKVIYPGQWSVDQQNFARDADRVASWLIAVRSCLLGLSLGAASWGVFVSGGVLGSYSSNLIMPLITFMVLTAVSYVWLRSKGASAPFALSQFVLDVLLVTLIVYVTGGPGSPFLFLYLPVVMGAAILWSRLGSLLVGGACVLSYSLLAVAVVSRWIPPGDGSSEVMVPTGGLLLQIIGLASAAILIGIATSYLMRTVRVKEQMVAESEHAMHRLNERHAELMNTLPDGLVTADINGIILSMNRAARVLLRLPVSVWEGSKVTKLFEVLGVDSPSFAAEGPNVDVTGQFELPDGDSLPRVRISYRAQSVPNMAGYEGKDGSRATVIISFQDVTKLHSIEEQLRLQDRMARLLADQQNIPSGHYSVRDGAFVGDSPVMQKVFGLIERVAPSDATVLIHGESGTGKELVAKAIHIGSSRCDGPFLAINCGAIPENLIEAELFGHKKGAFTGAVSDHEGYFRQASGGTLFLDEIGELPVHMQSKLLRAIQEKLVRPVGGDREYPVDVRIVAATNRNLRREIEAGNFREDLYYRLNVIGINLPPLRERTEDIPLLVNAILRRLATDGVVPVVPPESMRILTCYNYPGNVRELENILERAYVLGGSAILPEHLPENIRQAGGQPGSYEPAVLGGIGTTELVIDESISFPVNLDDILSSLERRYLEVALIKTRGAKKKAADLLGMNFRSFRYRLQKFGISDED